jgi:hypothetical protein
VIIIGFELTTEPISPKAILVDSHNRFVCDMTEAPMTTVEKLLAEANT